MPKQEFVKQPTSFTLQVETIKWLDRHSKRMGVSRSQLLEMCVENAMDDWKMLEAFHIKPEYIPTVKKALKEMKKTFASFADGVEVNI